MDRVIFVLTERQGASKPAANQSRSNGTTPSNTKAGSKHSPSSTTARTPAAQTRPNRLAPDPQHPGNADETVARPRRANTASAHDPHHPQQQHRDQHRPAPSATSRQVGNRSNNNSRNPQRRHPAAWTCYNPGIPRTHSTQATPTTPRARPHRRPRWASVHNPTSPRTTHDQHRPAPMSDLKAGLGPVPQQPAQLLAARRPAASTARAAGPPAPRPPGSAPTRQPSPGAATPRPR